MTKKNESNLEKRKQEILDRIFITPQKHIKLLENRIAIMEIDIQYLRRETKTLRMEKVHTNDKTLNILGRLIREFEIEFEKTQIVSEQTRIALHAFWEKLDRELLEELFPEVAEREFIRQQKKVKIFGLKFEQKKKIEKPLTDIKQSDKTGEKHE